MILLWSTSDKLGARLIRWGRDTDCSHFAVLFDKLPSCGNIVAESRMDSGVDIDPLGDFKDRNRIVHALEYTPIGTGESEEEAYQMFIKKMEHRAYDKKAVLWLAMTSLLRKLKISNPYSENKWGDAEDVYCQEVITCFGEIFARDGVLFTPRDIEMLDPHQAYAMLVTCPQFRKIEV